MPSTPRTCPAELPHWRKLLVLVILVGLSFRLAGLLHDLPFSYFGDEMHLVKRAMAMGNGDLNPHWFHKPALLMYLLLFCFGVFYAAGSGLGIFTSVEMFGAYYLADAGPFVLIGRLLVVAFSVLGLWATFALARRAFGTAAGLAAAATAAVLVPLIIAAQVVKEDLPAGTLTALAVYLYLARRDDDRLRVPIAAAACAGLAMAIKYYGICAIPVFLSAELARRWTHGAPWRTVFGRGVLIVAVFIATFFAASPYHLLDPTWGQGVWDTLAPFFDEAEDLKTDPDTDIAYQPGFAAVPGALIHLFGVLASSKAVGPVFGSLAAIGFARALWFRETRWTALVIAGPIFVFALMAATIAPYHSAHRHLNAVYPLLCIFILPGVLALTALFRGRPWRGSATATLVGVAIAAAIPAAIERQIEVNRPDSREVAHAWMKHNLPAGARILADGYGPMLTPDATAVQRLQAKLAALPVSPFTHAQAARLDLLQRYPAHNGFNYDELSEPWWLAEEVPTEELVSSEYHLDMGNPLVIRIPEPLAAYRAKGVRYLVLTSETRALYESTERGAKFPSYQRFLQEVAALRPIHTIDPASFDGKGPAIWVYDLDSHTEAEARQ